MTIQGAFLLSPQYRDYVWGGSRLRPGHSPTAEAWVVYEQDQIASGIHTGKTLAEIARMYAPELLGQRVFEQSGSRFPLLIKLLDVADWLSLQVHPNDEQAVLLEGDGFYGKTEAWYFIESQENAEILCGLRSGTTPEILEQAIKDGYLIEHMQRLAVKGGDSIFIPPGMIHALGPGLLLYEVQQTSDITYRVFDWNRPLTSKRQLHIEKSLQVADPTASGKINPASSISDGGCKTLITCPYFTLELLAAKENEIGLDTGFATFNALTVTQGSLRLIGDNWELNLKQFDTALVPGASGAYRVCPLEPYRLLRAFVE